MKIAIVNQSSLDDREVGSMVAELMQRHADLFEKFGVEVLFVPKAKSPPDVTTKFVFVEDESGVEDWGRVKTVKTLGFARVFTTLCLEEGVEVVDIVNEQVLELMGDASVADPVPKGAVRDEDQGGDRQEGR